VLKHEALLKGMHVMVDAELLRAEVRQKYKEVAADPGGTFHFHTGRPLAKRLGYADDLVGALPDVAVESFAGVANPFSIHDLAPDEALLKGMHVMVDAELLRAEVRQKYKEVAADPGGTFHFHTGRPLAKRLGYADDLVGALPDVAVESFAGVANPFSIHDLAPGERVVDIGSGAGFDSFIAAALVGETGAVTGVDMTTEMLDKSRAISTQLGLAHVEFREGLAEALPVADGSADVVISNGVFNLCADKQAVFDEVFRVLRPGGRLQFADIANGNDVPEEAVRDIDLWTA
jgi:arsenite methyltransferase